MQILEQHFIVFQYIGFWRPTHWPPGWKSKFYNCYTWFVMLLLIALCLSELTHFLMTINNTEALASSLFMLLTVIAVCGKGLNLLMKRNEIRKHITILSNNPYRPSTEQEHMIQRKFDLSARFNFIWFAVLGMSTISLMILQSLVHDIPQKLLLFEAWFPFDYRQSFWCYSVVYSHQVITIVIAATLDIAFDTLLPGLMLETCAQLNILKNRFHEMPSLINKSLVVTDNGPNLAMSRIERKLLSQCVQQHLEIIKFAKTTNILFGFIIFIQYTISGLVICMNVVEVSKIKMLNLDFISHLLYIMCLLTEIYMFCYYGCQVSLESTALGDTIYEMDWHALSICARRSLVTILCRTLRPIKYTSFQLITLDLESFKSLLKISYSTYNVLQQT